MPKINSPTPDATTGAKGKIQLAGNLSGTAAAPTVVSLTYNTQVGTTNTTLNAAIIKEGWSFINAVSGTTQTLAITFPTAFSSSIQQIQIGVIGARTTSDPAAISDFNVGISNEVVTLSAVSPTTTGFTASMYKTTAFSTGVRYGFWWRAVGV